MNEPSQEPGLIIKIPPPLWALVALLAAWGADKLFDWTAIAIVKSVPLGIALMLGGFGVAIWGRLTFAKVGAEILPASETNSTLVDHGPFRYSRNPMYAGILMLFAGISLYVGTLPYFAVTAGLFWLLNTHFIPFEEAKMERLLGQAYVDYKSRVRRWV